MTKKQKKNSIAKILSMLGKLTLAMLISFGILAMFAFAYLQQSYRLNPPSDAERSKNPVLTEFLAGKGFDDKTEEVNPSDRRLSYSPSFKIEECRKPMELCRVGTLLAKRRK